MFLTTFIEDRPFVKYSACEPNSYTNPTVSTTKKIIAIQKPYDWTVYIHEARGKTSRISRSKIINRIETRKKEIENRSRVWP